MSIEPTKEKDELHIKWVAETFGLLVIPAIAYFLTFIYESKYCGSFGIPLYLIRPDVATILTFSTILIGSGTTLIFLWDLFLGISEEKESEGAIWRKKQWGQTSTVDIRNELEVAGCMARR